MVSDELASLIASHEHEWQYRGYAWHMQMTAYACNCRLIKRVTSNYTSFKEYNDMKYLNEARMVTTENDARVMNESKAREERGEDPNKNEYERKQKMSPRELSKLADWEEAAYEVARARYGEMAMETWSRLDAYENSVEIIMYGNFVGKSQR